MLTGSQSICLVGVGSWWCLHSEKTWVTVELCSAGKLSGDWCTTWGLHVCSGCCSVWGIPVIGSGKASLVVSCSPFLNVLRSWVCCLQQDWANVYWVSSFSVFQTRIRVDLQSIRCDQVRSILRHIGRQSFLSSSFSPDPLLRVSPCCYSNATFDWCAHVFLTSSTPALAAGAPAQTQPMSRLRRWELSASADSDPTTVTPCQQTPPSANSWRWKSPLRHDSTAIGETETETVVSTREIWFFFSFFGGIMFLLSPQALPYYVRIKEDFFLEMFRNEKSKKNERKQLSQIFFKPTN